MSRGGLEVNVKKKRKKVKVPTKKRTITIADNILEDPDQATELAVLVNLEEHQKREEERRTQEIDAALVLDKEIDQEVNEDFKEQMELKFKDVQQITPNAQLLVDLKKGSRESREAQIGKQIPNGPGEGSSMVPDSLDYSDSSDSYLWETSDDEKTDSTDSDVGDDQAGKFGILVHDKDAYGDIGNLFGTNPRWKSLVDHAEAIEELVQANVINEVKNQLPKFVPKVSSDFVKPHLERTVLDVMKKNLIILFKSSTTSSDALSKYDLKKLYDMTFQNKSFNNNEDHSTL
ncbi:hypothetical protein Tco_1302031 [Tanacetum coccineum]